MITLERLRDCVMAVEHHVSADRLGDLDIEIIRELALALEAEVERRGRRARPKA